MMMMIMMMLLLLLLSSRSDPGKDLILERHGYVSGIERQFRAASEGRHWRASAEATAFRVGVSRRRRIRASVDVLTKWLYIMVEEITSVVKMKKEKKNS